MISAATLSPPGKPVRRSRNDPARAALTVIHLTVRASMKGLRYGICELDAARSVTISCAQLFAMPQWMATSHNVNVLPVVSSTIRPIPCLVTATLIGRTLPPSAAKFPGPTKVRNVALRLAGSSFAAADSMPFSPILYVSAGPMSLLCCELLLIAAALRVSYARSNQSVKFARKPIAPLWPGPSDAGIMHEAPLALLGRPDTSWASQLPVPTNLF